MKTPDTQIIIMAAGKGTRMKRDDVPKVMVPILGKPMLQHMIETIESLDLPRKPVIVIGYKRDHVTDHFGDRVNYAIQEQQLGTAHAVMAALPELAETPPAQVVILNGDHPFVSADLLSELINTQAKNPGPITLASVNITDPEEFQNHFYALGRMIRDKNGSLMKIVEKKDATEQELAVTEINPQYWSIDYPWLTKHIAQINNHNAAKEYYLPSLLEIAFDQGHTIGSVITETAKEAYGINTHAQLAEIERRFGV